MDWRREIMHYCVAIVVYLIFSNWPFFLLQLWSYFISNGNHFFCLLKFRKETQTVIWTTPTGKWERLSKLKSKINKWLFMYCFWIELQFGKSCYFCGGRKTGEPGEKPLEQGWEPTTHSTTYEASFIWIWTWAPLVLSPLLTLPRDKGYVLYLIISKWFWSVAPKK